MQAVVECHHSRPRRLGLDGVENKDAVQRHGQEKHEPLPARSTSPESLPAVRFSLGWEPRPGAIVNQEKTKRDREEIEERVVTSKPDDNLQKQKKATGRAGVVVAETRSKRGPESQPRESRAVETCFDPFGRLIRPPTEHGRERLRPVMVIERGQVRPGGIATRSASRSPTSA